MRAVIEDKIRNRTWPTRFEDEILDAANRVMLVSASEPIEYIGMGAYGIVFCDKQGFGYKAARRCGRRALEDEAEWLRVASAHPVIRGHVPKFERYFAKECVIKRACVSEMGRRSDAFRGRKNTKRDVYEKIAAVMMNEGFGMPEFKDDSFRWSRGTGWVMVDASNPILKGRRLVARAVQALRGKEFPGDPPGDIAWALRMEAGATVDAGRAHRLSNRLETMRNGSRK